MNQGAGRPYEQWETILRGVRRKIAPVMRGPWFQYQDAVGFEWNTFEVSLESISPALDGFRIIHLSDLHCKPRWQTAYDDLLDRLNEAEPDLILITGDIVDYIMDPERCLPIARKLLSHLRARQGVLGVLGNHDECVFATDFAGTPLRLIDGQRLLIPHNGAKLELIGVPGPLRKDCPPEFAETMPEKTAAVPRIVLSHYPDHIRRMARALPDLFLTGHTHGGQICLPGMIPIIRHDSLPIQYFHGVHQLAKTKLFVNRGLGFSTHAWRIFCPAEVIEIRLQNAARTVTGNAE